MSRDAATHATPGLWPLGALEGAPGCEVVLLRRVTVARGFREPWYLGQQWWECEAVCTQQLCARESTSIRGESSERDSWRDVAAMLRVLPFACRSAREQGMHYVVSVRVCVCARARERERERAPLM